MGRVKFRIDDFCEDLNYHNVILYIGNVDTTKLLDRLKKDDVNHLCRFDQVLNTNNLIYIENCDLQTIDFDIVNDYVDEGFIVAPLKVDSEGYYFDFTFGGRSIV